MIKNLHQYKSITSKYIKSNDNNIILISITNQQELSLIVQYNYFNQHTKNQSSQTSFLSMCLRQDSNPEQRFRRPM